ncbi:MAG: MOSC domain-containing protein [Rariglobus sp.]
MIEILKIFVSPAHNYFGHHGKPAGDAPTLEVHEVECVAGSGLRGDRYFDYKTNYKGQITFFADEVFEDLCAHFQIDREFVSSAAFRRNVITRGVDLNSLIGQEFEIQGIRFSGTAECTPCYWMDQAFHPGAEKALKGRGGLRARILTDGVLRTTAS